MDIMELGAIGELVGGVAVLATLVYLAAQVRQGTHLATGTSQREVNNAFREAVDGMAEHRAVIVNGLQDFGEMSKDDQWRFAFLVTRLITSLDQTVSMFRQGLETEATVTTYGNVVLAMISEPGGKQWWDIARPFHERTPVAEYLESRLRKDIDLPPPISAIVPWFVQEGT